MPTNTTYRIISASTDEPLGDYTVENEDQALDAFARDAGCSNYADMLDRVPGSSRDDVKVVEVIGVRAVHGEFLERCDIRDAEEVYEVG